VTVAREFFIYIMASPTRNTYIGVTNNLERRVWEHKNGATLGYASKIGATKLVYVETYPDIRDAIAREKDLKDWRREKKIALIESQNPFWNDLSRGWYEERSRCKTNFGWFVVLRRRRGHPHLGPCGGRCLDGVYPRSANERSRRARCAVDMTRTQERMSRRGVSSVDGWPDRRRRTTSSTRPAALVGMTVEYGKCGGWNGLANADNLFRSASSLTPAQLPE
jgi:putative endonuclease